LQTKRIRAAVTFHHNSIQPRNTRRLSERGSSFCLRARKAPVAKIAPYRPKKERYSALFK
jgi:hypothetical protein